VEASVAWRTGQSGAPPNTARCASHDTRLLGFDRWSFWLLGHRTVRWCTEQSLFTVRCAFWRCSDFCARRRALFTCTVPLQTTFGAVEPLLHWHTGQSGATPNSPVNYSGAAPRIPEGEQFGVELPGAPDSPVRQTRAHFGCLLLFLFEPFLGIFTGLLWTFGTCKTYNLEQTS
jgi:hypothetical protein